MNLIEFGPDQVMIAVVETAGEGDLGTGGQHHLGFRPTLGGEEVPAVDHCRGQVAMVYHRPGARPPGRSGVALELLGGDIAEEFHAVASLDEGLPLCRQALELD